MHAMPPSDATTRDVPMALHQVGPKYGVRDFLKQTQDAWRVVDGAMPWMNAAIACQKRKLRPEMAADVISDALLNGQQGPGVVALDRTSGRRMGKPIVELASYIGCGAMLHGMTDDEFGARTDEVLSMSRSVLRIEPDRTVWTMTPGHMAMTRHALERIYHREHVSTGQLIHTIRTATMDMVRNMSVAVAAGLHLGTMPVLEDDEEEVSNDAATFLIPMGTGLLVTETRNCISTTTNGHSIKAEFKKHGATMKAARPSTRHALMLKVGKGDHVLVEICHVGKTYLSEELLRPEQIRYRDLFREACLGLDTEAVCLGMFGGQDAHRAEEPVTLTDLPHLEEMRDLLPRCVRHQIPIYNAFWIDTNKHCMDTCWLFFKFSK